MRNTFDFIGKIAIPNNWSNVWANKKGTTKKIRFGVKPEENNTGYVQFITWSPAKKDVFYTSIKEEDSEKYNWKAVKLSEKDNQDIVDRISYYNKFFTNIGVGNGNRKTFVVGADFLEYIKEKLPEIIRDNPDQMFRVRGNIEVSYYKGKKYYNYEIKELWLSDEEEGRLHLTVDMYYTKESLSDARLFGDNKYDIKGYLPQYISDIKKIKYVPVNFVYEKVEDESSLEAKRQELNLKALSKNIKVDDVYHLAWLVELFSGAPILEEVDENDLTEEQKELIKFGLEKKENFVKKSFGENVTEFRLIKYLLHNEFDKGRILSPMKKDDFEEEIYNPNSTQAEQQKAKDFVDEAMKDLDAAVEEDDLPF